MNLRSLRNRWRQKILLMFGDFVKFIYGKKNILKGNNIIVLHQGRCGSSLFAKKLTGSNSHKIKSFSEIVWFIPKTNLFLYNRIRYKITFLKIKKNRTNTNIINLIFLVSLVCKNSDRKPIKFFVKTKMAVGHITVS